MYPNGYRVSMSCHRTDFMSGYCWYLQFMVALYFYLLNVLKYMSFILCLVLWFVMDSEHALDCIIAQKGKETTMDYYRRTLITSFHLSLPCTVLCCQLAYFGK